MPKDIVICTNEKTILEELAENFDENHEDFFPVSNYPKDIEVGKSRLYLSNGEKITASFLIKEETTREWQGKEKKVLLLKKFSGKQEDVTNTRCAAMGGFRYLDSSELAEIEKKRENHVKSKLSSRLIVSAGKKESSSEIILP